jgi:methylated-DNA-[protein]-cysteine S-methyltransferase
MGQMPRNAPPCSITDDAKITGPALEIFPSALGWMGVFGVDGAIKHLTFGHESPAEAWSSLAENVGVEPLTQARAKTPAINSNWMQSLVRRLQLFAAGAAEDFSDVQIDLGPQTEFQQRVVDFCRAIPAGQTRTYTELAEAAGSPRAARAVGNCMAHNPLPLIVPCHRVVAAGGATGGYSAGEGIRMKLRLLEMEALHGNRKSASAAERKPAAALKMAHPASHPAVLPKDTLPKSLTRFFPRRSAK